MIVIILDTFDFDFVKMKQFATYLFDLFFPKTCLGCKNILLYAEKSICTRCRHELPLTESYLVSGNEMEQKFNGIVPINFASSLFYFYKNHFTQELIHNLKYRGHQQIGSLFGDWYGSLLQNHPSLADVDCIIPIPLHPKRFRERGYNQVESFGKALASHLHIPYQNDLLYRKTYAAKQSKKNKTDRQKDAEQWFDLSENRNDFYGKHFLLIDDVLTTGVTLETASKKLLEIPNTKVSIVTIAYAKE